MDHDTLLLLFCGAIGLGAAIALFPHFCRSTARTARTKGLVTGNVVRETSTGLMEPGTPVGADTVHAQVTFTVGGVERNFVSDTGFSWMRETRGSTVGVVYDPKDPSNAGLERYAKLETLFSLAVIVGAGSAGVICSLKGVLRLLGAD